MLGPKSMLAELIQSIQTRIKFLEALEEMNL